MAATDQTTAMLATATPPIYIQGTFQLVAVNTSGNTISGYDSSWPNQYPPNPSYTTLIFAPVPTLMMTNTQGGKLAYMSAASTSPMDFWGMDGQGYLVWNTVVAANVSTYNSIGTNYNLNLSPAY